MLSKIFKKTFEGVILGNFILSLILLVGALLLGDDFFNFSAEYYIKNMLASCIAGIAFSIPTIIYSNEKLSRGMQILIHMGIGLTFYIPLGFFVGWFPVNHGICATITTIISIIIISMIIWTGFYLYYKKQAKKINKKIHENNN